MIDFDMSTPQIIKALKKLGVDFDQEVFLEDIKHGSSLSEIGDRWVDECNCGPLDHDVDFVSMAPIVLWRRLAPETPCIEMIHDEVERGYDLLEKKEYNLGFAAFWKAWNVFKALKPKNLKKMDLNPSMKYWSGYCFGEWSYKFENELQEAWKRTGDKGYCEQRAKFCHEYWQYLPEDANCPSRAMNAAESYWNCGAADKGEEVYQKVVKEWPNEVWAYNCWGSHYFSWHQKDPIKHNYAKAEEIYTMGIRNAKGVDVTQLTEQLEKLYRAADSAGVDHLLKKSIEPGKVVSIRRPPSVVHPR